MAIEPRLNELKGSSRLALGFFNSIIRRIECTKPLAGNNVVVVERPDGIEINVGSDSIFSASAVTLNVCSNGTPATLIVYGVTP